ncbi:zinc-dependent peptidase [Pseudohongiella sp. O18]|uniref:M90 family metallopeptidase n=1 Tax=Pseudohongiella sp. O18 TaxID=2904248 RepID=UPI001F411EA7|nr:M90 family metallopeptidase [Pseudohongiella sp. O18]
MDQLSVLVILFLCVLVVAVVLWLFVYPAWRRQRLEATPFPVEWEKIVKQRLPFYGAMSPELKRALQVRIAHFIADKRFEGCAGQVIDDDVRVSIAAQACLLILNRPSDYYSELRTILVYPAGFVVRHDNVDEFGLVSVDAHALSGESWNNGRIVLSWEDVKTGASDFRDGINVVLHEFAHQLDHQSGATNGAPLLADRHSKQQWASVFSAEFGRLQALAMSYDTDFIQTINDEVLDFYGATEPAEFFAVSTEAFFEKPGQLAMQHPQLFEQLENYYGIDPRSWGH